MGNPTTSIPGATGVPGSTGTEDRGSQDKKVEMYKDQSEAPGIPGGFQMAFPDDPKVTGSRENPNHGKRSYPAGKPTL